jgi:histidine triad (HIT) family protein
MSDCIFCKITAKQIPSKVIYEDDDVLAFHDINPAAPVHFLIVPKQHVATLADCTASHADLLAKIMLLAPKLAAEQGCGYVSNGSNGNEKGSGGFKTLFNTGPDGGQEVYHLHLHVIGGPQPWRGQR